MNLVYDSANLLLMRGRLKLDVDPLTVLLLADTYQPDPAHSTISDVQADELTAAGYARQTLRGQRLELVTAPVRYYVIARGDDLIGCVGFAQNKFSSDGLLIHWTEGGVLRLGSPAPRTPRA